MNFKLKNLKYIITTALNIKILPTTESTVTWHRYKTKKKKRKKGYKNFMFQK